MEEETMKEEKNKYLDKLKVVPVKGSAKEYPTFNLMLSSNGKKFKVTNKFIFGDAIGATVPFFVFNIKLEEILSNFTKLLSKIPDEIMLENIKLINKLLKGKSNLVEDLSKITEFKSYLKSFNFMKNKIYEIYKETLKKLFLFSKTLFESVFEEFRKFSIESNK